jgi:hypothetical protein
MINKLKYKATILHPFGGGEFCETNSSKETSRKFATIVSCLRLGVTPAVQLYRVDLGIRHSLEISENPTLCLSIAFFMFFATRASKAIFSSSI